MEKIGKPRGLIDYLAFSDEAAERSGMPPRPIWKHVFRPRTILYTTLWSFVGVALVVALLIRGSIDLTVAPVRNPTFVMLSDGTIRNTYNVRLRNKNGADHMFRITVEGAPDLVVNLEGSETGAVLVPANETLLQRVYVAAPKGTEASKTDRTEFDLWVEDLDTGETVSSGTVFNGRVR
jgi:polyferredoxin